MCIRDRCGGYSANRDHEYGQRYGERDEGCTELEETRGVFHSVFACRGAFCGFGRGRQGGQRRVGVCDRVGVTAAVAEAENAAEAETVATAEAASASTAGRKYRTETTRTGHTHAVADPNACLLYTSRCV